MTAIIHKDQKLDLSCTGMDREGAATALHDSVLVHVAGALPGERVRATVVHVSPHLQAEVRHAWATLDEITQAAPDRVAPPCPCQGRCPSCPLMVWAPPAQLRWKRELVMQALGLYPVLGEIPVAACVPSPLPLGYRGNAKLVVGRMNPPVSGEPRLVLGAYAPRSHELVDMADCPLGEPVLRESAALLGQLLRDHAVEPFDEIRRTGMLRYVLLRANQQGQVLVTLVSARATWPQAQALAEALHAACPAVCGVIHNVNPSTGNVLLGPQEHLLWGTAFIDDTMGPATVRLGSRSFAQANRGVAGLAYAAIVAAAEKLGPIERVIDAYAGAGGIALSLAPLAREVVAIEESAAATATAQAFVAEQGMSARVRFLTGDAAQLLSQQDRADVVVLNPPRKGCAPEVLAAVARMAPRLVAYLSCNPETLARDLAVLARAGLTCTSVTPFDMLAQTPHVEALALVVPQASRH